jgi:hypothetical protein
MGKSGSGGTGEKLQAEFMGEVGALPGAVRLVFAAAGLESSSTSESRKRFRLLPSWVAGESLGGVDRAEAPGEGGRGMESGAPPVSPWGANTGLWGDHGGLTTVAGEVTARCS